VLDDGVFVSVLGFKRRGQYCAVALEMDIWAYGKTPADTFDELRDLVSMQVGFAIAKGQPEMIYRPAEFRYFEAFRAAHERSLKIAAGLEPKPRQIYRALPMHITRPEQPAEFAIAQA